MDLALNNLQMFICHKTQTKKKFNSSVLHLLVIFTSLNVQSHSPIGWSKYSVVFLSISFLRTLLISMFDLMLSSLLVAIFLSLTILRIMKTIVKGGLHMALILWCNFFFWIWLSCSFLRVFSFLFLLSSDCGNLLSFLIRCGTRPYERDTKWDSNSLVQVC